ncbi:pyridoxamine 5'-phosphate oxidase family protein [Phenylobacterium sp.]|uniref:pyridoxamine 5'-phosphate oxidase family protein n=1 Tax=Phenylobacterium sp. TaxID=1871053 RepID=UPI00286C19E4|nr:pyridoxamine 5'-phosphate oxidase family protein [Phenylobacterium sp.]
MYHQGNRDMQDAFGSRALADRLEATLRRSTFNEADTAFIAAQTYFFLATANAQAAPDCSFKGGPAGFAQVTAPDELIFPDYDGNGMFKSLGNIAANPQVGLLFIGMGEKPQRLRVNGIARILDDDPRMAGIAGAQLVVSITPTDIFPNCPRYIPSLQSVEPSPYTPTAEASPVEPAWKSFSLFADVVPPRRR